MVGKRWLRGGCLALCVMMWMCLPLGGFALASDRPIEITEEWPKEGPTEFIAIAGKKLPLYRGRTTKDRKLATIEKYTMLDVVEREPKWTEVIYEGQTGFLENKYVELTQRRDPFAGNMPNVIGQEALALMLEDTKFVPPGRKLAVTLKAGTYISIERVQEEEVEFSYRRIVEYASIPREKVSLQSLIPWDQAQPGDLIAAFSTYYPQDDTKLIQSRIFNIGLACDRITGVIVSPGEEFSYNKIVGPYTAEGGYKLAPILSGSAANGYGGGTCQVSSTLYNVILRVPSVVVERHWHSAQGASYLPANRDATVGSVSDLRFRNVLPYAVRLGFTYGDGVMTALMYRADGEQGNTPAASPAVSPAAK